MWGLGGTAFASQHFAIVLALILVGFVGYTAGAAGGSAMSDSQDGDRSYWRRVHPVGLRLHEGAGGHGHHGGGGFGHHIEEVVERLDLSPTQAAHLEAMRRNGESLGSGADGSTIELHRRLVGQFERGAIEAEAFRTTIDQHLAEVRRVAYSATSTGAGGLGLMIVRRAVEAHGGRVQARRRVNRSSVRGPL